MIIGHEPALLPAPAPLKSLDLKNIAAGILGYRALETAQQQLRTTASNRIVLPTARDAEQFADTRGALPEDLKQNLGEELDNARAVVIGWDETIAQKFNEDTAFRISLEQEEPEKYLKKEGQTDWRGWAGHEASDHELLDFLAWNAGRIAAKQQAAWFAGGVDKEKATLVKGIKEGLGIRYLHYEAEEAIPLLGGTTVLISDFSDTMAHARGGYTMRGSGKIVMAEPRYAYLSDWYRKVIRHEGIHETVGYFSGILDDEAATEHLTQAVIDKMWGDINPLVHKAPFGSYPNIRHVKDAHWRGRDVRYWTRAFSARSEYARQKARAEMKSQHSENSRRIAARVQLIMELAGRQAEVNGASPWNAVEEAAGSILVSRQPSKIDLAIIENDRAGMQRLTAPYRPEEELLAA